MTELELLKATKKRIETIGWTRGTGRGKEYPACLVHSLFWANEDPYAWEFRNKINLDLFLITQEKFDNNQGLMDWNDSSTTTEEMVLEVLDIAISKCVASSTLNVTP